MNSWPMTDAKRSEAELGVDERKAGQGGQGLCIGQFNILLGMELACLVSTNNQNFLILGFRDPLEVRVIY